jgi:YHS domain-containing protein
MIKKMSIVLMVLLMAPGLVVAEGTCKVISGTVTATTPKADAPAPAVNVANKVCPVTGAPVAKEGEFTVAYEGKIYNLCCGGCKDEFLKDPAKYIAIVDKELAQAKK